MVNRPSSCDLQACGLEDIVSFMFLNHTVTTVYYRKYCGVHRVEFFKIISQKIPTEKRPEKKSNLLMVFF